MYGVLYSVGGKLGIVDTVDGVIELIEKEVAVDLLKKGIDISGMVLNGDDAVISPFRVDVAYQLCNYGEGNANIFSVWQNVEFLDKHREHNAQHPEGDFKFRVKKNNKYKAYKGTWQFRQDCSSFGVAGQGIVISFSNNVRTVVPMSMIKPYIKLV